MSIRLWVEIQCGCTIVLECNINLGKAMLAHDVQDLLGTTILPSDWTSSVSAEDRGGPPLNPEPRVFAIGGSSSQNNFTARATMQLALI